MAASTIKNGKTGYEREIGTPAVVGLMQGFMHNFFPQGSKNQLLSITMIITFLLKNDMLLLITLIQNYIWACLSEFQQNQVS